MRGVKKAGWSRGKSLTMMQLQQSWDGPSELQVAPTEAKRLGFVPVHQPITGTGLPRGKGRNLG